VNFKRIGCKTLGGVALAEVDWAATG